MCNVELTAKTLLQDRKISILVPAAVSVSEQEMLTYFNVYP